MTYAQKRQLANKFGAVGINLSAHCAEFYFGWNEEEFDKAKALAKHIGGEIRESFNGYFVVELESVDLTPYNTLG